LATCAFFGHRDCPEAIRQLLVKVLEDLIENQSVDDFLVGNNGRFDSIVASTLRELSRSYPHIQYHIVLAYLPEKANEYTNNDDFDHTLYPEGIETTPKRFAISWRNRWMVRECEFVVCYITHSYGGAAQYVGYAQRQRKTVINLANL
jgi:uncharacterized phage-like protein YoqJ